MFAPVRVLQAPATLINDPLALASLRPCKSGSGHASWLPRASDGVMRAHGGLSPAHSAYLPVSIMNTTL